MGNFLETYHDIRGKIVLVLGFGLGFYHLYSSYFGMLPIYQHRILHVMVMLFLTFLSVKFNKSKKLSIPVQIACNTVMLLATAALAFYMLTNHEAIMFRQGRPDQADTFFFFLMIVIVLAASYTRTGWSMVIICSCFLIYLFYGHYLEGELRHAPIRNAVIVSEFFNATAGFFASPVGVSSTFIILFVIFGEFLNESGAGEFFNKLSIQATRNLLGGPAKTSVIASLLMGMINGSTIANIATTGAFTIPLMKKTGYPPHFAGAVEVVSSMGGQIMPPVMGASVFLMAELTELPYARICYYAIVPALLYYYSIYLAVHFKAVDLGLKKIDATEFYGESERVSKILVEGWHYIFSIAVLVGTLVYGYTPYRCGFLAIITLIVTSTFRKKTRMSPKQIMMALARGTRSMTTLAVTCVASGIIIGSITTTALGIKLSAFVLSLSGGSIAITLALTIIACIILGMGVVSGATYIILASLLAPVMAKIGVPIIVAHLFIYTYGLLATMTPPVALGALTAAGMAEASFLKTCVTSMRLAIVAFVIPIIYVYDQRLMLMAPIVECIQPIVGALVGLYFLNAGWTGVIRKKLGLLIRIAFVVGGFCCILPDQKTDIIGFALLALSGGYVYFKSRKEAAVQN